MSKNTKAPTAELSCSSEEESWESSEEEEEGEYAADYQPANLASTWQEDIPAEQYGEEAPIKYDTVRFFFDVKFRPSDLFSKTNGALKNEGKLILSVSNGKLTLDEHSNHLDFPLPDPQPLDARKRKHHKRSHHKRRLGASQNRDIVKEVTLSEMTCTWPTTFGVELSTVRRYNTEGWHQRSEYVTKTFAPFQVAATQPKNFPIFNRMITKGTIIFQNRYPGANMENFSNSYSSPKGQDFVMIPYKNPFFMYFNAFQPTDKQINGPSKGLEAAGLVQMPKDLAKKFTEITRSNMKSNLSFGDVTTDFAATFFVPMPTNREASHAEFLASGKGQEWQGFADKFNALTLSQLDAKNGATTHVNAFRETEYRISGFFDCRYKHTNNGKIPMNTKQ
jgi:hypothetical protein